MNKQRKTWVKIGNQCVNYNNIHNIRVTNLDDEDRLLLLLLGLALPLAEPASSSSLLSDPLPLSSEEEKTSFAWSLFFFFLLFASCFFSSSSLRCFSRSSWSWKKWREWLNTKTLISFPRGLVNTHSCKSVPLRMWQFETVDEVTHYPNDINQR